MENSIKNKIISFFNFLKAENDVDKSIENLKNLFKDDFIIKKYETNEAYYQEEIIFYYLKNSNGIKFEISSGDWDRNGRGVITHEGKDLYLQNVLSSNPEYKNGIKLFSENKKVIDNSTLNKIIENIDVFLKPDLSNENLRKVIDDNVFETLNDKLLSKNEAIFIHRYENLKHWFEKQVKREKEYEDISPYGGLDVTVHSVPELLYNRILEDKNRDKDFFEFLIKKFNQDFPKFIDNKLDMTEHALYIIEHKEEYNELIEKENGNLQLLNLFTFDRKEIEQLNEEQGRLYLELDNYFGQINKLENKKYNFLDKVLGRKELDEKELNRCKDQVDAISKRITDINVENDYILKRMDNFKQEQKEIDVLKSNLERPFKNFTIDYDLYEEDDFGKYGMKASLDLLVEHQEDYLKQKNELLDIKRILKEYDLSQEKEINQETYQIKVDGNINENYIDMLEAEFEEDNEENEDEEDYI